MSHRAWNRRRKKGKANWRQISRYYHDHNHKETDTNHSSQYNRIFPLSKIDLLHNVIHSRKPSYNAQK